MFATLCITCLRLRSVFDVVTGHAHPSYFALKGPLTMAPSKRHAADGPDSDLNSDSEDDLMTLPPTLDLKEYATDIPEMGRPLRIAMPCIGIDGCGEALKQGDLFLLREPLLR